MSELRICFTPVTIGTPYFAFLYLRQQRLPGIMPGQHLRNRLKFITLANVIKLKDDWISLATINTLLGRQKVQ